jgi:hypothetical protein
VYDESMSYYETLCKVVGQLNITGETVNKLNEGLTGEIADRQAADAELDERLKVIEDTNKKIHFLVFDGANPNGVFPTRHELYQWVEAGDAIFTLLSTYEEGRGLTYAASCSYNAGNWGSEASNDFNIIVPLETTYDSTGKLAVKQKIVKLTIPPIPQTNLNAPWGLQIIEINTPSTSAEGIVNFSATVDNENTVHANLSPAEFTYLYRAVSKGSGLIVGVNAQLTTNDSQLLLSTTADIIGGETASDDEVRIVFDAETSTGERGLDLPYLTRLIYILSGSGTSETWTLTEFETYDFAFDRYEGFQFTRAANNAITPAFGSTPKEVAEYFGTVKGGTPYQNLPVRLIDTVNNAEYWNGVFDRKSDGRISYTFTTSYYRESKMLVRIIELSATPKSGSAFVGDEKWVYAAKEFELPLNVSNGVVTYTASKVGEGEYKAASHKTEYQVDFAEGVPAIITSIEAGNRVILRVDLKESGSELGATPLYFASGYTRIDIFSNAISYVFSGSISNGHYTLELNSGLVHATLTSYGEVLPEPNPDGTDNGKVPTINGNKWELKTPDAAPVDTAMSDTSTNAVQNKVIKKYVDDSVAGASGSAGAVRYDAAQTLDEAQRLQARKNIGALGHNSPQVQGYLTLTPANEPLGIGVGLSPSGSGGGFALDISDVNEDTPTLLTGVKTPTDTDTNAAATVEYVKAKVASGGSPDAVLYTAQTLTEAQKKQARENVDAAGVFVVNATITSDVYGKYTATSDKTFGQIQEAVNGGKRVIAHLIFDEANIEAFAPITEVTPQHITFVYTSSDGDDDITLIVSNELAITRDSVGFYNDFALSLDPKTWEMPQIAMASDPVGDMHIATKKYVDDKAKKAVVIDVSEEEVKSYNYSDIDSEITNGGGNVWLSLGTNQMRMVAYDKSGASSYELTFVNSAANGFNIHTITVSPSAASYTYITK